MVINNNNSTIRIGNRINIDNRSDAWVCNQADARLGIEENARTIN